MMYSSEVQHAIKTMENALVPFSEGPSYYDFKYTLLQAIVSKAKNKNEEQHLKKIAHEYLLNYAEKGTADMKFLLGDLYFLGQLYGQVGKKDYANAVMWYELAYKQDKHVQAAMRLYEIYLKGKKNVSADPEKAIYFLEYAVAQGEESIFGCNELARLYQDGEYIESDSVTAYKWTILANLGRPKNPLPLNLDDSDVMQATALASEWYDLHLKAQANIKKYRESILGVSQEDWHPWPNHGHKKTGFWSNIFRK